MVDQRLRLYIYYIPRVQNLALRKICWGNLVNNSTAYSTYTTKIMEKISDTMAGYRTSVAMVDCIVEEPVSQTIQWLPNKCCFTIWCTVPLAYHASVFFSPLVLVVSNSSDSVLRRAAGQGATVVYTCTYMQGFQICRKH